LPHAEAARAYTALRHLPELRQRLRELERRVGSLENAAETVSPRTQGRPRA
jgi:hypothetical protein